MILNIVIASIGGWLASLILSDQGVVLFAVIFLFLTSRNMWNCFRSLDADRKTIEEALRFTQAERERLYGNDQTPEG